MIGKGFPVHLYFIDSTPFAKKVLLPLLKICKVKVSKLEFKMMDVKDERGELVRIRIPRVNLFKIQKKIIESSAYKALRHDSWEQDRIQSFIEKGVIDGGICMESESSNRVIFIIEVVKWHMNKLKCDESLFIIEKRPWLEVYQNYASERNISLFHLKNLNFNIYSKIHMFTRNHPWLYAMLKSLKSDGVFKNETGNDTAVKKLYIDGRGDLNCENDGKHSDFFWQMNSNFPAKNILYQYHLKEEREYLNKHGIYSVSNGSVLGLKHKRNYQIPRIRKNNRFSEEAKKITSLLKSYDLDRYYWSSFFKKNGVKVFLTWFKYSNQHMAISDAVSDNGGISAIWQMAFDGFEAVGNKMDTDILFSYSNFSEQIERQIGSNIKYNVITGYPKDYAPPLLKEEAQRLREKLKANGAKKIVFAIDENSVDDSRWHTGNEFQRENYSYILEQVLKTPWLGVVFKPKTAKTLRHRLGAVADLLDETVKTGRCHIYEESGRHTTSTPPVLAGLSADICIHGHLDGGTAALECALEGLPTLFIDREGCPNNKFYELPEGKVIFKNWPDAIDAVMEHFSSPEGIPEFGDWSSIIDELDPFRDGMAANRMGNYLHWLIEGFEQGLEKDVIMASVAERYQKEWGEDKVLIQ